MAQNADDEFDPSKNAFTHLTSHVLQKGFQAGSVIGVAVVAPIMCYRAKSASMATVYKAAAYSSCVGTLVSGKLHPQLHVTFYAPSNAHALPA
jgi:hypothetical protein